MKYGIDEALAQIEARGREMKIQKKRKQTALLAGMIAVLLIMSSVAVYRRTGIKPVEEISSSYGAFMLSEEAGGYILVGVVSFTFAVALTLVCLRFAGRRKGSCGKGKQDGLQEKAEEEARESGN